MSRYLVTGGAGFIGSHITERLLGRGHTVRVLDNFSSGKKENLGFAKAVGRCRLEIIRADIRQKQACARACARMDYVLHQAALRSVPKSLFCPREYNEVNIQGTLNMLEAAVRAKVKRFVFASSSSVYGEAEIFPQKEDFPALPVSPYALTKLAGEHYCRIFSRSFRLSSVALRYFNVFGPRQSADDEYAVVIPKFITCLLKGERPPIYGSGEQSRDFTYVENVVEANLMAATRPGSSGEVFNVAGGHDYSVLELVKILNNLLGKDIRPLFLKPRPGDVFRTMADLTAINKGLGYSPQVDFVTGLKHTIAYFQNA
jgi:nucleoside-diphosphate-sugar epimerase